MKNFDYFCESCNAPVPESASSCPNCGRRFAGVKCPKCGKKGFFPQFVNGCPQCGHLAQEPYRSRWPASRYWLLSTFLVLVLVASFYFWFKV